MTESTSSRVHTYITTFRLGREYAPRELASGGTGFHLVNNDIVTSFLHSGQPMRSISYVEFAEGQVRGNHFHRVKEEHLCVLRGAVSGRYHVAGHPEDSLELELSAGSVVVVLPGCVHTYTAMAPATAIEFSPQPFDEGDTIRVGDGGDGGR